ncbi:YciI family protein [Pararhizobium sp. LjRoot238]|uniref:YciI family protein n=1 Tax=Pararhizobium sp. LjRoot238 TaxID=3342293 RepID=UPI003ECDEB91
MFILSLTYKVELTEVDRHLEAHVAWLKAGYEAGLFLASGRKNPRNGGVILARGDRSQIDAAVASDPFSIHGIADYSVTDFTATMTAPGLEALKE